MFDDASVGGLWDLAVEICNEIKLIYDYRVDRDIVYRLLREYIERQNYCPHCGTKMAKE